jgi:flagellar hook-associated protein 2
LRLESHIGQTSQPQFESKGFGTVMSSVSAINTLLSSTSSSSIDLSSILQAATGSSSSGIDVTAAVSSAITAARAPETAWEDQLTTLSSQTTALTQIQTYTSNLDNDLQYLNSLAGPLSSRTVSSSNSSIVSATAVIGTTPASHTVVVSKLATTASWTSGVFSSSSAALPAGSFTINVGSGASATITTDGSQTLSDVASQINTDDTGVTARVITDASGSRLAIVSNTSGKAADFTISTTDTGFGFSQAAIGDNASLTVDGIGISSATNSVTGAIPGVTLNLVGAAAGTSVTLSVAPDTSSVASAIGQFITDYNTLISSLTTQFTFDGTSEGVLASDSVVRNLQSEVLGSLGYTYTPDSGTTTVSNLTSLGISVNDDGTMNLSATKLQNALQSHFSDVQSFFQGTGSNGFASTLGEQLDNFISPGTGAFTVDLQSISSQTKDVKNSISDFETNYITPLKTQLTSEFSEAEILLQQLPAQLQQINTLLGYNTKSS